MKPEVLDGNDELGVVFDGSGIRRGGRCLICHHFLTEEEVEVCKDCEEEERGVNTWKLFAPPD